MPGKSQQNQVYSKAGQAANQAQQQQQQFMQGLGTYQAGLQPINTGYQSFAQSGGVTPQTQQEYQRQQSDALSSLYGDLQNKLTQNQLTQGGYAPGYGANLSQLGRQESQAISQGYTGLDVQLQNLINQGKLAGLSGMGQTSSQQLSGLGTQLASMGLTDQQIANMLGIQSGIANRPGWFSTLTGTLERLGSAGGSMLSGIGDYRSAA